MILRWSSETAIFMAMISFLANNIFKQFTWYKFRRRKRQMLPKMGFTLIAKVAPVFKELINTINALIHTHQPTLHQKTQCPNFSSNTKFLTISASLCKLSWSKRFEKNLQYMCLIFDAMLVCFVLQDSRLTRHACQLRPSSGFNWIWPSIVVICFRNQFRLTMHALYELSRWLDKYI